MEIQDEPPFITIVIPTLNRKKDLVECINSIQNQNYPKDRIEVVVFDNASIDGTNEAVESKYSSMRQSGWQKLKFIRSSENIGSYLPFNKAISMVNAKSKYIIGMDDDVKLERNCLQELTITAQKNPMSGVVGARSVYDENPRLTAYGAGFINWWFAKFSSRDVKQLTECDYVIGCCFLFKKEAFIKIGGMDDDYFMTHWEMDFCSRLKKHSYKIYYQPRALAIHKISMTRHKRSRIYYLYRNKLMFIKKNSPFFPKLLSLFIYFVLWVPKVFFESVLYHRGVNRNEMRIIWKGLVDGFSGGKGKMGD